MKKIAGLIIAAAAASALAGCAAETQGDEQLDSEGQLVCSNQDGTNAMIASLAAAMGTELGRWEVLTDFTIFRGTYNQENLKLSTAGLAQCAARGSACNNIKALLHYQDALTDQQLVIGGQKLSAWTYASRLATGYHNMQTYKQNNQFKYVAHKLTLIGSNPGGCDTMYNYSVTNPDGSAMASTDINNLVNALKFGEGNGPNPYIAFQGGMGTCSMDPSGNVTEGDNSNTTTTTTTTTSGTTTTATVWGCQKYNPPSDITGQSCTCSAQGITSGVMRVTDPAAPTMYRCRPN